MERYIYRPLSPGERCIRLLRLLPGSRNAEIRCEIVDYQINLDRPFGLYEALSYCWGDPSDPERIFVKDQDETAFRYLDVTANLFAGLLRLRDSTFPRLMWIDAICINQNDVIERGEQVQFMATIYASASQVVVWLGDADIGHSGANDCDEAFASIHRAVVEPESILAGIPQPLCRLFDRPWFSRVWILQEIAAARALSILYGNAEMSSRAFIQGLQKLSPSLIQNHPTYRIYVPAVIELMAYTPGPPAHQLENASSFAPLAELIEMFHVNKATDQRDKVYALLGLRLERWLPETLLPDYQKPWGRVFQHFIEYILGTKTQVLTWTDRQCAVIAATCCTIGIVDQVHEGAFSITCKDYRDPTKDELGLPSWKATFQNRNYCKHIQAGDVLCKLNGATFPTVIRRCEQHFDIIVIAITSIPVLSFLLPGDPRAQILSQLGSTFLDHWISKLLAASQHNVLLVWDLQQIQSSSPVIHEILLAEAYASGKLNNSSVASDLEQSASRQLNIIRILDGVSHVQHDRSVLNQQTIQQLPSDESHDGMTPLSNLLAVISSPHSSEALTWLLAFTAEVRHCIRMLKNNLSTIFVHNTNPEHAINVWAHEASFDYGVLGLVDLEHVTSMRWAHPANILREIKRHKSANHPWYWEFGECRYREFLEDLFPTYRKVSHALRENDNERSAPSVTIPFDGRYIIRLLLAQSGLKKRRYNLGECSVRLIGNHGSNILLLGLISEACYGHLSFFEQYIANMGIAFYEPVQLAFIFGECWQDRKIAQQVLAKFFISYTSIYKHGKDTDYLDHFRRTLRHTLFNKHASSIILHIRALQCDGIDLRALYRDHIVDALMPHLPAPYSQQAGWIKEGHADDFPQNVEEGGNVVLDRMCEWILSMQGPSPGVMAADDQILHQLVTQAAREAGARQSS